MDQGEIMRIFDHFNKESICPICGNNDDKPCTLVEISGTEEGNIIEAEIVHIDCLDLTMFEHKDMTIINQLFKRVKP
jgi:hypothetical protein